MMKRLIFMVGMLVLTLTFANAQSSNPHFRVLSASVEQVKIRVIKDTKLYSIALTAGSKIYGARYLANKKGDVRWANGSTFRAGSSMPMPKSGAMQLTAGTEIVFTGFGAPADFKFKQIMILTEPEAKPIYLRKP
jgi:hypothetical protein